RCRRCVGLLCIGVSGICRVLVVGHRWAPRRIRVVVGTRSCDGAGLRPGGGRDRLAAVLVVVAGRRGRRTISVACTGLLRSPGGRIGGGGRLSSGASPQANGSGGVRDDAEAVMPQPSRWVAPTISAVVTRGI